MSSGAESRLKRAVKFTLALFSIGFIFSKWMMKSAVDRIQILRNKTQLVLKQASRGIALFLEYGQDATGRPKISSGAESPWKTVAKSTFSIFSARFNSSKCTMAATSAVDRIQLLRNKTLVLIEHMRCDIALLLHSGKDSLAHNKVQDLIAEQNFVVASWFIERYCELIVHRRLLIAEQRECPTDLKEAISGLIFTASRRSDIPELLTLRNNFEKKYGRDFVRAAIELRPGCCVLRMLSANLTSGAPGEVKMKVLKEIAKEYNIQWDPTKSETELLKPREMLYY